LDAASFILFRKGDGLVVKVGTVADFESAKEHLPPVVREEVHGIAKMLDQEYGAGREIDTADGGYLLCIDSVEDLKEVALLQSTPEQVYYLGADERYINALFLTHNEFGVNVIIPAEIASACLLEGV